MSILSLTKKGIGAFDFTLRRLTAKDFPAVSAAQETVVYALSDPSLFVPTPADELKSALCDNLCYGIFDGSALCAYAIFSDGKDGEGLCADAGVSSALIFDTVAVMPDRRGYGMQYALLELAVKEAEKAGKKHILATVSPKNPASHANFTRAGFSVLRTFQKYGFERYLLLKNL